MDLFVVLIVWHSDMNFNLGVGMEETIAAYLMWRRAARRKIHTDASLALLGDLCNITRVLAWTEEPLAPRHPYLLTGNNNYN